MKKLIASLSLGALVLSGCASTQNGDLTTVKIGVISPLSGDAAAYGTELQRLLDYTLPSINEAAKEQGYEFELVYEDGRCNGSESTAAFQKLSELDGIEYFIGGVCSSESFAIAPLLEESGAVAVSPASSNPDLEGISPNFFTLSYSDADVSLGIAEELAKFKKVAIISEQNDFNIGLHDNVVAALEGNSNVEFVADESFAKGGTDFRNLLQKVKAANPEVVFFNSNPGVTSSALVKQYAELDWDVAKVSHFALLTPEIAALAPEKMEGTIIVDTPAVDDAAFNTVHSAIVAEKGTLDNFGKFYSATSLDALSILTQAIMEHDGEVSDIVEDLSEGTFAGYLGSISFDGKTFVQGIDTAKFTITNGTIEAL